MNQNLPDLIRQIPPPTPEISKGMSQQELFEHRDAIVSEVRAVLVGFYQPSESDDVRARHLAWWADELQEWTIEQIVYALRKFHRDKPDTRPRPGHILKVLKQTRGQRVAERMAKEAPPPEPAKERPTADRTAEIMAEVGFPVRRFPRVGEGAE